jgi:membrane-bound lytic murein transglycosylase B
LANDKPFFLSISPGVHQLLDLLHESDLGTLPPKEQLLEAQTQEDLNLKGWDFLFSEMVSQGVDPIALAAIFSDERMPKRETLFFSVVPRESRSLYRRHNTRAARNNAMAFYRKHYSFFRKASSLFDVPEEVILSILQVETKCGSYTGNSRVFFRLARLASAADRSNILENYRIKKTRDPKLQLEDVQKRAEWLKDVFLPHTIATLALASKQNTHPLEIRGSQAGAIGLPQFLPGNIETFGFDADSNGQIDLFVPGDAILSVAKFLTDHGWNSKAADSRSKQREVIAHYNRSEPYVDTVLAMSKQLKGRIESSSKMIEKKLRKLANIES